MSDDPFIAGQIVGARMRSVPDGIEVDLYAQESPTEKPTSVRLFLFPDRATELASNLLEEIETWKRRHQQ